MKVHGNQLKQAIKMKAMELEAVAGSFEGSLHKFEDETKSTPEEIAVEIFNLEAAIAKLQSAQKYYNTSIEFDFEGSTMTLQEAINLVGGAGRISKMWRKAANGEKKNRYSYDDSKTRDKNREIAMPTISKSDALKLFKASEKRAATLRNLIAEYNTKMVDISYVTENLLD